MDRITLATTTGSVWLSLLVHAGAGMVAILAGYTAVFVAKGGRLHRQAGAAFQWSMILMGVLGSILSAYQGRANTGLAGAFVGYLVLSGILAVRPAAEQKRHVIAGLAIMGAFVAASDYWFATVAWRQPRHSLHGVPAGMMAFMGTIALLGVIGDARVLRHGPPTGQRRLARHLWRMCFALFVATGSFFLGQMRFIPEPVRNVPILLVLAFGPLVILLYWMWRVLVRKRVKGILVAT